MANDQQNSNYGSWGPTDPQHNQWQPPQNERSFQPGAQDFQPGAQDFQQPAQQWAPQASGNQPLPPEWQTDQTQQIPQPRQGWNEPQQGWGDSSQPVYDWENSNYQQPSGQWDQQQAAQWGQQPSGQWDPTSQQARPSQPNIVGEFFTRLVDFNFTGLAVSGFIKTLYVLMAAVALLGWIFGALTLFQFGSLFASMAWLELLFGWIGAIMWIGVGRAFLELVASHQSARQELAAIRQNTSASADAASPDAGSDDAGVGTSEQGE